MEGSRPAGGTHKKKTPFRMSLVYSQGLGVLNNFVYSFYCVKRRLYYFSLSLKHKMFLGPNRGFSSRRRDTKKDTLSDVFCVLPGTRTLDPLIKSQLLYQLS